MQRGIYPLRVDISKKGLFRRPAVYQVFERHAPMMNTMRIYGKGFFYDSENFAGSILRAYQEGMRIGDAIRAARKAAGISQAELAHRLDVTQGAVSAWELGRNEPPLETLNKISKICDAKHLRLALDPVSGNTRVMGYVGAGSRVYAENADTLDFIRKPPGAPDGAEAVIVRGNSMLPLLRAGQVLVYWSKHEDPTHDIGELCVCKLADDESMLVKTVMQGSKKHHFTLTSLADEPIVNVLLEWTAPVELILRRANWSD